MIDETGKMAGIMSLSQALSHAENVGLDLIEVAPNSKPPTCKIMDYGKYKYEQKKKEVQARKNQTVIQVKEIRLRLRTDTHDLNVKTKKMRNFLTDGCKVKTTVRFSGRELAYKTQGFDTLKNIADNLSDISFVEVPSKIEGRQMFMILAPGQDPNSKKDKPPS